MDNLFVNDVEIHPIFSTPIFHSKVFPIDEDTKTFIFNLEYERNDDGSAFATKSKKILTENNELSELKNNICSCMEFYVREVLKVSPEIEFYLTHSWVNKQEPGDWGGKHIHSNSLLSGVVYLQTPKDGSGKVVFEKDNNMLNLFPKTLDVQFSEYNLFNSSSWSFQPEEGTILMFPSMVSHLVTTNTSNMPRYSLAYNFFARGSFGEKFKFELK